MQGKARNKKQNRTAGNPAGLPVKGREMAEDAPIRKNLESKSTKLTF